MLVWKCERIFLTQYGLGREFSSRNVEWEESPYILANQLSYISITCKNLLRLILIEESVGQ